MLLLLSLLLLLLLLDNVVYILVVVMHGGGGIDRWVAGFGGVREATALRGCNLKICVVIIRNT